MPSVPFLMMTNVKSSLPANAPLSSSPAAVATKPILSGTPPQRFPIISTKCSAKEALTMMKSTTFLRNPMLTSMAMVLTTALWMRPPHPDAVSQA
ncbi:secreted protein [Candidatus Thiomargarita nelsonii]|uniref:Secreted protein n=1 Tax=Candidatus Thiomargarita nelsonii TaxID=1003181 RepID=A0A176RYC4_9GAMM|nr:secreted protein [Candidatus Thiomargarita nelsonii]